MSRIDGRFGEIAARVAAAARRGGRDPATVRIVGASKQQDVATLAAAYAAGLRDFGENRVQEARAKAGELPNDIVWHLLGPLQSNKVRPALDLFTLFHAVDRTKIARALDAEASARGVFIEGMLEINVGGEASKHGFSPATLAEEAAPLAALAHLRIIGLMTIPPPSADPEGARAHFRALRALRDELELRPEWRGRLRELSMGMSDDFEVAVEEGSTLVRVGTALFGPRS